MKITNYKTFIKIKSVVYGLYYSSDSTTTMTQFCTHLKTFLFRRAYCT